MGIVTLGIPQEITLKLAALSGADVFVETGTFQGGTTRWAAGHFPVIHTIERSEKLYAQYEKQLNAIPGVTTHLGDSRDCLPAIVRKISDRKAVYWLDGHWSGGETAGADDECPLLDELSCLVDRSEDIILIDDARLFLCAPPAPHLPTLWPTLPDILDVFKDAEARRFVQIVDDVIFMVPPHEVLKQALVEYAQARADYFLSEYERLQNGKAPVYSRIMKRALAWLRKSNKA
ncbi:MAG: hypothetical protein PHX41_05195 [Kiritimatiellae bacterium]|nr:hypothetical protein [Kiritimatiellia bacterium]